MNYISGRTRSSNFRYTGNPFQVKFPKSESKKIAKEEWCLDSILNGLDTVKNLDKETKIGEKIAGEASTAAALGRKPKPSRKRPAEKLPGSTGEVEGEQAVPQSTLDELAKDVVSIDKLASVSDALRERDLFDSLGLVREALALASRRAAVPGPSQPPSPPQPVPVASD